jgi:hypothetical protein
MKTAPRISLFLAVLLGFASPGIGQGSMSCFTVSAQSPFGRNKSPASPSTNGFTISAHRDFDRSVAITVSSATRFWFLDATAPGESLVAAGRYGNATLWAQASRAAPVLALIGNSQPLNTRGSLVMTRNREYGPVNTISRLDAALSQYDESQLASWIQSNIRFANVDPVP